MRLIILYVISFLFLTACRPQDDNSTRNKALDNIIAQKNGTNYVILPSEGLRVSESKYYKNLILSAKDILDVDSLLTAGVIEWNSESDKVFKKYSREHPNDDMGENPMTIDITKYKRQYTPFINEKLEKEVWVYCACDGYFGSVEDGGKCYFHLKINLTKRKYTPLEINSMG